jgi:hypothetical protein
VNTWTRGKLSSRAEYYAGRGVNRGDLNEQHLEMIYQGVLEYAGSEAAGRFVLFVEGLENMSATAFVGAFYDFFYSKFTKTERKQTFADNLAITGRSEDAGVALTFGMMELLHKAERNPGYEDEQKMQSLMLKAPFLAAHGKKVNYQKTYNSFETSWRRSPYGDY